MVKKAFKWFSGCAVILAAIAFTACKDEKVKTTSEVAFDASYYELNSFSGRVHEFLKSRPETKELDSYQAMLVNTEGCDACVKGSFSSIHDFLSKTTSRTLIFANDSTLLSLVPPNKQILFVYLPAEVFKSADIFHSELYLYKVNGEKIRTLHLGARERDSLNKL